MMKIVIKDIPEVDVKYPKKFIVCMRIYHSYPKE